MNRRVVFCFIQLSPSESGFSILVLATIDKEYRKVVGRNSDEAGTIARFRAVAGYRPVRGVYGGVSWVILVGLLILFVSRVLLQR
jgi:hypothetical protein